MIKKEIVLLGKKSVLSCCDITEIGCFDVLKRGAGPSGLAKLAALTITLGWCISEATNQAGTTYDSSSFYFFETFL